MTTRKLERQLYLAQRGLGDVRAAREGRLPRRLVMRHYHRWLIHRAGRLWTLR